MEADPRSAYSYRHPRSGEWAHPRHVDPLVEAHQSYVTPAWELLAARVAAQPQGPVPGRPWRALVVGFGRGFECAALAQRRADEAAASHWEVIGLEPHPGYLQPWPPRWSGLRAEEAPWWGHAGGSWELAPAGATVRVLPQSLMDWCADAAPASCDLILLDLFSPAKHPEDWAGGWAAALARIAAEHAVLAGYSCARSVREALHTAGWNVERIRRPGLRDTLRAGWTAGGQA